MASSTKIYTVGQVNGLIKAALNQTLPPKLIVRGEVRDFKHHHSGHCYFSLKDGSGILPCVMWASRYKTVKFTPEDGMAVLAKGYIDVYAPGGKYQFYVDRLDPEGVGALQVAFDQMVAKLEAEGLFADEHKQPLPAYPQRIAVLTSESGAAWHDIVDSIHRRWPAVCLSLWPVPVQGEGAAARIAAAIRQINAEKPDRTFDLLIVGRGGGSLEDLWAFNEEVLARAIFASKIPIISAVGHEVDTTVADLVADARASTPTQAGMVAVPDQKEVLEDLSHYARQLGHCLRSQLNLSRVQLEALQAHEAFRRPEYVVRDRYQLLDDLEAQMRGDLRERLVAARERLQYYLALVRHIEPHRLLGRRRVTLGDLTGQLQSALSTVLNQRELSLAASANRLEALDPKSVLQRGFSITRHQESGRLIRNKDQVQDGDLLITELAGENFIASKVTKR